MWLDNLGCFLLNEVNGLGSQRVQLWLVTNNVNLNISSSFSSSNVLLVEAVQSSSECPGPLIIVWLSRTSSWARGCSLGGAL